MKICNSLVSWGSRNQDGTGLCTAESEYVAIRKCCKKNIWLRPFFYSVKFQDESATSLNTNNTTAKPWTSSKTISRSAKHIDVRFHFSRECIDQSIFCSTHVSSRGNLEDGFKKPLPHYLFKKFCLDIGVNYT